MRSSKSCFSVSVKSICILFKNQLKVLFWNTVIFSQVSFVLVPEVFNAVDMVVFVHESLGTIDAIMQNSETSSAL